MNISPQVPARISMADRIDLPTNGIFCRVKPNKPYIAKKIKEKRNPGKVDRKMVA